MTLKSGWNMPPGCFRVPGDEATPCAVCGLFDDDCACPECFVCTAVGDPACYEGEHPHIKLTKGQMIARTQVRRAHHLDRANDEAMYEDWLKEQPDSQEFDWSPL